MKKSFIFSALAGIALCASGAVMAAQDDGYYNAAVSGDYHEAVRLLMQDVARGDAAAMFNLALMYHKGLGVPMDEAVAVSLYHQAAELNYPWAQEFLAVGYQEGWFGLKQSSRQARYWQKRLSRNEAYY